MACLLRYSGTLPHRCLPILLPAVARSGTWCFTTNPMTRSCAGLAYAPLDQSKAHPVATVPAPGPAARAGTGALALGRVHRAAHRPDGPAAAARQPVAVPGRCAAPLPTASPHPLACLGRHPPEPAAAARSGQSARGAPKVAGNHPAWLLSVAAVPLFRWLRHSTAVLWPRWARRRPCQLARQTLA
jgi:hypothetical protein